MKKNNKNGFAITELLAVTVVIMVIFTTIYSNFLPTAAEYERRIEYNDVSSQYAAHYIRKLYMNYDFESEIGTEENQKDTKYLEIYNSKDEECKYIDNSNCSTIMKSLGVKEVIVTYQNMEQAKKTYNNTELKKYISYLPKYNISGTTLEEYRIVVKTETGYATTELKVFKPAKANKPTLTENLLPVAYDENKNSWVVVDEESDDWYNYDDGLWANAVTIVESKRSEYFNDDGSEVIVSDGTKVPLEDINTMWVWIPRYKYTVFNYNLNGTTETSVKQIFVEFETLEEDESGNYKPTTTGTIKCEDNLDTTNQISEKCYVKQGEDYVEITSSNVTAVNNAATYTHPAFWWDKDSDNIREEDEELTGIWVGKFENSLKNSNIIIKPNEKSLIEKDGAFTTQINYIMQMNKTNNPYGFSSNTDTHLIKNREWGAVTYLAYSQYGIGDPIKPIIENVGITQNKSDPAYTGMSTCTTPSDYTTCKSYNENTTSSTNRNITGIYDMVGGAYEYVLGGNSNIDKRITAIKNNLGVDLITGTPLDTKYYDQYLTMTQEETKPAGAKIGKLGDATKETYGIITNGQFIYGDRYVILRRGNSSTDGSATIFTYLAAGDLDYNGIMGSRSVLVIEPNYGGTE